MFEGRYYLALNGNVYIADSHLTEEDGFPAWFFWANVPAQCLAVLDDRLWFGTADGTAVPLSLPDEADAYTDDGAAIDAYWCTPTLSLSDWSRNKTIRDVIPTLMPYARSSAELCFTDEGGETQRLSRSLGPVFLRKLGFRACFLPLRAGRGQLAQSPPPLPPSAPHAAHRERPRRRAVRPACADAAMDRGRLDLKGVRYGKELS